MAAVGLEPTPDLPAYSEGCEERTAECASPVVGGGRLDDLAAAIVGLSDEDRARLAELLAGGPAEIG
jgi:hypothetical protein